MKTRRLERKGQMGFTLLELLISITLLGFIVIITAGALRAGYRSTESAQNKIEALERFNIIEYCRVAGAVGIYNKEDGRYVGPGFFPVQWVAD